MTLMAIDGSLRWIGTTFAVPIMGGSTMLAMWLLLSKWPLGWRWMRQVCDICKTWLWVTRTWAAIVLALAIPAALAHERPSEPRPALGPAHAVRFASALEEFAPAPPRQPTSAPPQTEALQHDQATTFSREPVLAERPPAAAAAYRQPEYARTGREPAPWVPQYENRSHENTARYEAAQSGEREYGPFEGRDAPRTECAPTRENGRLEEPPRLASLGERLFFENRLSRSGNTGCASCHRPERAFSDVGRTSQADDGKAGRRNAPSLINSGALPSLLWDGRLRTLEQQALEPWKRGEMGITVAEAARRLRGIPEYVDLFREHLGQAPSASGMAAALAAYQRTLIPRENRFERYLRGGDQRLLSHIERDGHLIFEQRAGCGTCHVIQPAFRDGAPLQLSDFQFHNTGVAYRGNGRFADAGRAEVTKRNADRGAFRTPALRNLGRTAPYMHDGSIRNLKDVVEFYDRGGRPNPNLDRAIRPLYLTDYEKEALVAFLLTLDDPPGPGVVASAGRWSSAHR
jgi:cytochrome c peroxidase